MMKSKEAKAFDLSQESSATKSAYGTSKFGEGCLLARRLVEAGVKFVEVVLGGWDTHQDNFDRVKNLSQQVDPAMSSLIGDLKDRGLLDSTLVIWMGEFGRTPRINTRGPKPGRDHYPRAWSTRAGRAAVRGAVRPSARPIRTAAASSNGKTSAPARLHGDGVLTSARHQSQQTEHDSPSGRPDSHRR